MAKTYHDHINAEISKSLARYFKACYGGRPISGGARREITQAFVGGVVLGVDLHSSFMSSMKEAIKAGATDKQVITELEEFHSAVNSATALTISANRQNQDGGN